MFVLIAEFDRGEQDDAGDRTGDVSGGVGTHRQRPSDGRPHSTRYRRHSVAVAEGGLRCAVRHSLRICNPKLHALQADVRIFVVVFVVMTTKRIL